MANETKQLQVGDVVYHSSRYSRHRSIITKVTPKQAKCEDGGGDVWIRESFSKSPYASEGFAYTFKGVGETCKCYLETPELKADYEDYYFRKTVCSKLNNRNWQSCTTDQLKQIAQILNIEP